MGGANEQQREHWRREEDGFRENKTASDLVPRRWDSRCLAVARQLTRAERRSLAHSVSSWYFAERSEPKVTLKMASSWSAHHGGARGGANEQQKRMRIRQPRRTKQTRRLDGVGGKHKKRRRVRRGQGESRRLCATAHQDCAGLLRAARQHHSCGAGRRRARSRSKPAARVA